MFLLLLLLNACIFTKLIGFFCFVYIIFNAIFRDFCCWKKIIIFVFVVGLYQFAYMIACVCVCVLFIFLFFFNVGCFRCLEMLVYFWLQFVQVRLLLYLLYKIVQSPRGLFLNCCFYFWFLIVFLSILFYYIFFAHLFAVLFFVNILNLFRCLHLLCFLFFFTFALRSCSLFLTHFTYILLRYQTL